MEEKDFLNLVYYLAAPLILLGAVYMLIQKFLDREYRLKLMDMKRLMQRETLPLRLQAFERLILFLERISPNNMLQRVVEPDMTVRQFQMELINSIRSEFEHNVTQQIYVSPQSWMMIRGAKEEMIRIINLSADSMNPNAPAMDLSKAIFETMIRNEDFPTQKAIDFIKQETALLF